MREYFLTFILAVLVLVACATLSGCKTPVATNPPSPPAEKESGPGNGFVPLSWESRGGNTKSWSEHTIKLMTELLPVFDKAQDAERFCPKYRSLSNPQRINMWAELISAMAKFESNWKPTTQYTESTMGIDPITKKQVVSEGLLQLSYQDVQWAKFCQFDWNQDKSLPLEKRSILDPIKNIDCGSRILARQIERKGKVIIGSGAYWAVIKENSRYKKIDEIITMTSKLTFCQ